MNEIDRYSIVLCVDDHADSCELYKTMLEARGLGCDIARSSEEAVSLVAGRRYAAVVASYRLPRIDGPELCERIRALDGGRTPVIIFSSEPTARARERSMTAGAHAFFIKPDDLDGLIDAIVSLAANRRAHSREPHRLAG